MPTRVWHEAQYGYVSVDVSRDSVTSSWYHRVEANSYTRSSEEFSYSVTPRPVLWHSYSPGRLTLFWSGPATLQVALDVAGSFTEVPAAVSPFVITNLNGPQVFYRLAVP